MLRVRSILFAVFVCLWYGYVEAETSDLQNCETHLNKYRKFILQAILSFEDVCDVYNARAAPALVDAGLSPQIAFFGHYQTPYQNSDVWHFFKMFMAQFNDMEFSNVIRDAVTERCRTRLQMQQQQRDEKRNSVVLGKKQRFHSWGGKRSGSDLEQEHNDDGVVGF